jgi:adenylate kinase
MVKEREILAEVLILINEQSRMLEGRLSDADLTRCTSRAEQIKQLLEVARRSSSQHALVSPKLPTPG